MGKSVWDTPSKPCPYCGSECEADWFDIGVGMHQCGPYYCDSCGASEIGPEGSAGISDEEKENRMTFSLKFRAFCKLAVEGA